LAGLLVGSSVNFVANRLLIFHDTRETASATQAARFAALMSALFLTHALSVAFPATLSAFRLWSANTTSGRSARAV
jgi:putative flippase GtrA